MDISRIIIARSLPDDPFDRAEALVEIKAALKRIFEVFGDTGAGVTHEIVPEQPDRKPRRTRTEQLSPMPAAAEQQARHAMIAALGTPAAPGYAGDAALGQADGASLVLGGGVRGSAAVGVGRRTKAAAE